MTMESMDEGYSHQAQHQRRRAQGKRARTGCERCRARRRKCDEEKPRCRRCVDANAECQYTTRLTFLDKNAQTLTRRGGLDDASERLEYPNVQFMANENGASLERSKGAPSHSSARNQNSHQSGEQPVDTSIDVANETQQSAQEPDEPSSQHAEQIVNAFDETVIESLDSLDPSCLESVTALGGLLVQDGSLQPSATPPPQESTDSGMRVNSAPLAKKASLTSNGIDLLKHYICHVAPWLDIFDLGQTFGLLAPPLAMTSPLVLSAVLKLAAASSGSSGEEAEQSSVGYSNLLSASLSPKQVPALSVLQYSVTLVFLKTQLFAGSGPEKWEPSFVSGGPVPTFTGYDFEDGNHHRVWVSTVTLLSRLVVKEIAYSLIHEVAPAVGSEVIYEMLVSSEATSSKKDNFQKSLHAALRCLALLADVMGLCLQPADQDGRPSPTQTRPHLSMVERWKQLSDELQAWHIDRPSELQEVADLEGSGTSFPAVLFTNRVGVSTNIIYHVAKFLLLRHRPRKIRVYGEHSQTEGTDMQLSPQWHARRVCGIALSSDPQHTQCWDPCIIAAFALTARGMTHPAQQIELLLCLQRVEASGWRINSLIKSLRDEWGLYDP